MLEHGGRLLRAAREYGIEPSRWLDLSTGISPFGWPVPPVSADAWRRLPDDDDVLADTVRAYCRAPHALPVAGSQAAIQTLPRLRGASRVGVLAPAYAEHAHAWARAGHRVEACAPRELFAHGERYDVVVVVHPNNPTGQRFAVDDLLALHAKLATRGGWLILDEAFMDATPQHSLCPYAQRKGLIVLRSAGKFFGLAGARAGCVCAAPALLARLREWLGPWTLAGPTREVLRQAFADVTWQNHQRERLHAASMCLSELLTRRSLAPAGGCALFQWCRHAAAAKIRHALALRGILVRAFDEPPSLRFGLPGDDTAFERLNGALREIDP